MAFFNYATKEITLKVVYYGPGLSGKTTNLQHLYGVLEAKSRGKFISLATEADRTLFFDFLPVDLGKIREFSLRFQLYTVPGQIRYNATRKLVLKGADAVIFVADSQREMRDQNTESFENMRENLLSNNIDPDSIPLILQYNKRDLPNILSIDELNYDLNKDNYRFVEAEAVNGKGIRETFEITTKALLKDISKKHRVDIMPAKEEGIFVKIQEKDSFKIEEVIPPPAPPREEEPLEIVDAVEALDATDAVEAVEATDVMEAADGVETADTVETAEAAHAVREMATPPKPPAFEGPTPQPSVSDREMKRIVDSLGELIQSISDTKDAVTDLSHEIRETASSPSPEIKDSIAAGSQEMRDEMKLAVTAVTRELKESLSIIFSELNESRKQQSEIVNSLREIRLSLAKIKPKRRWFS